MDNLDFCSFKPLLNGKHPFPIVLWQGQGGYRNNHDQLKHDCLYDFNDVPFCKIWESSGFFPCPIQNYSQHCPKMSKYLK